MDDYLAGFDAPALAEESAPGAEQGTSYDMAALRHQGKPLLGFKAAKDHLAVFPFSPAAVDAVRDRLTGFSLSKGTVRFTADTPLPDDVVRARSAPGSPSTPA